MNTNEHECVVVCLPTLGRSDQFYQRAWELLRQPEPAGVRMVLSVSVVRETDVASWKAAMYLAHKFPERVTISERGAQTTAVDGWLQAYEAVPGADWYVLGADDVQWHAGWQAEALRVAELTGAQVIGLNDLHTNLEDYSPHYMMSGDYAAAHGFIPPGYRSWWFDREVCQAARAAGQYAAAWDAVAEHYHPDWGNAPVDATYRAGMVYREADRTLYYGRITAHVG